MKATFISSLTLFAAALASPLPEANAPRDLADILIKIKWEEAGYEAYERFKVDGPAFTVGNRWKGSSIDDNVDIWGGIMYTEDTLGQVKCVLQDKTRHDIVVLSEGFKQQNINGDGKAIKLTDHVVFCYLAETANEPVPTPVLDNTQEHPSNPSTPTPPPTAPVKLDVIPFTVINEVTQKSSPAVVSVDSELKWRFIDIYDGDVNIFEGGHVYATSLQFTADPVSVECSVYDWWQTVIKVVNSSNWGDGWMDGSHLRPKDGI